MFSRAIDEYGSNASALLLIAVAAADIVVRPRVGAGVRGELDAAIILGALVLVGVSVATLLNEYGR
ncbi:hypothetical protein [Halopelagius longus]|uniref:Uncharacterized protein n=1 Tax=Halopelagius longus TaxID=1236180 RepID=A0A1H0Y8J7_9EURY|nr:hypothetical protein [Halopelagius longus]RDI72330.1 hypothetical protein DWB78_11745 [Halopelagius longus]SDQ11236.1 hypothetical protein SAMN05216278_0461 [Halopelagius longus]